MKLTRFNPMKQKNTLPGFFDELFNRSLSDIVGSDFTSSMPSANIIEEDDLFKIKLAAPGLEKGDFDIEINEGNLIISAKKETKEEQKEGVKITRNEFNYSFFTRSFFLPESVNVDDINASYDRGVLTLVLNKNAESVHRSPRTINVK